MRKISLAIVFLSMSLASRSQNYPIVKDSTAVTDTLEKAYDTRHMGDSSASGRFSRLTKKPRRLTPTADLRTVDGLFLGLVYKLQIRSDTTLQKLSLLKSLRTKAIILEYKAEWRSVFKSTDVIVNGLADINGNILNFFGRGNETNFDQSGDFRVYYRANFSFFQLEPALRIALSPRTSITFGPSLQHFIYKPENNNERFLNTAEALRGYEFFTESKTHAGALLNLSYDTRDYQQVPSKGVHMSVRLHGYEGLNKYSEAFFQAFPQISLYKTLNRKGTLVLANRIGAGFTRGKTAFYQSAFLGSQDNLLGYRKFRFAGDDLVYNNTEFRLTMPGVLKRIKGKAGLIAVFDAGRVWIPEEESTTIHTGYGAGIFLNPLNRILMRAVAGFSKEGLQATVALRQRF